MAVPSENKLAGLALGVGDGPRRDVRVLMMSDKMAVESIFTLDDNLGLEWPASASMSSTLPSSNTISDGDAERGI